jgi:UDP-glucose 4-epimerase
MVVPRFVQAALTGKPLEVHGDGTQTRCFCHVSDTVRALRGLMESREATGDLFNVGSQERIAIRDLAERVRAKVESRSEITFVPYEDVYPHGSMEEMFHREPSLEKINAAIGWGPTRTLDAILDDVIAYERERVEATA